MGCYIDADASLHTSMRWMCRSVLYKHGIFHNCMQHEHCV